MDDSTERGAGGNNAHGSRAVTAAAEMVRDESKAGDIHDACAYTGSKFLGQEYLEMSSFYY